MAAQTDMGVGKQKRKRWFQRSPGANVWEWDPVIERGRWRDLNDGIDLGLSSYSLAQRIRDCREIAIPPWELKQFLELPEGM